METSYLKKGTFDLEFLSPSGAKNNSSYFYINVHDLQDKLTWKWIDEQLSTPEIIIYSVRDYYRLDITVSEGVI